MSFIYSGNKNSNQFILSECVKTINQSLSSELNALERSVNSLQEEIGDIANFCSGVSDRVRGFGKFQNTVIKKLDYFRINSDNIIEIIDCVCPDPIASVMESAIKSVKKNLFFLINPALKIFQSTISLSINHVKRKRLEKQESVYKDLRHRIGQQSSLECESIPLKEVIIKMEIIRKDLQIQAKNLAKEQENAKKVLISCCVDITPSFVNLSIDTAILMGIINDLPGKTQKNIFSVLKYSVKIYKQVMKILNIQRDYKLHLELEHQLTPDLVIRSKNSLLAEEQFYDRLLNCKTIQEVKEEFNKNHLSIEPPVTFLEWEVLIQNEDYKNAVVQSYLYHAKQQKPSIDSSAVSSLLEERAKLFQENLLLAISKMTDEIQKCETGENNKEMSFEEIHRHFAQLHVYLDRLDTPLKDLTEWKKRCHDTNFQTGLGKQYLDFQEANAQLLKQGLSGSLTVKSQIERKFLIFDAFESSVKILSSLTRLTLLMPYDAIKDCCLMGMIKLCLSDLVDKCPPLNFISLVYTKWDGLKVEKLFIACLKSAYGQIYRPHEYSLEGYQVYTQKQWNEFVLQLRLFVGLLQQFASWIYEKITLMDYFEDDVHDHRAYMKKLNAELDEFSKVTNKEIERLSNRIEELQLEDISDSLFPDRNKNEPVSQDPNVREPNAVDIMASSMESVDCDLAPKSFKAFVEKQTGVELAAASKPGQRAKTLRKLFAKKQKEVILSHRSSLIK